MTNAILIILYVYFAASALVDAAKVDRNPCWSTYLDVVFDLALLVGVLHLMEVFC